MNFFFRKYYDKTIAFISLIVVVIIFSPLAGLTFIKLRENKNDAVARFAKIGAEMTASILSSASGRGVDIWDTDYQKISFDEFQQDFCKNPISEEYYNWLAGGEKARFHTNYDTDHQLIEKVRCIQRAYKRTDSLGILYVEPVDRNGYVPWHGMAYKKCIGDAEWDLVFNREKRIWRNKLLNKDTPKFPFEHTTDFGTVQHLSVAPIWVDGKHWGWFIVAFNQEDLWGQLWHIYRILFVCAFIAAGIFHVFVMKTYRKFHAFCCSSGGSE